MMASISAPKKKHMMATNDIANMSQAGSSFISMGVPFDLNASSQGTLTQPPPAQICSR